ncbi:MAG: nucleotidyltransferase domain-containing protein [Candidatus Odinarchaeia archaeon]
MSGNLSEEKSKRLKLYLKEIERELNKLGSNQLNSIILFGSGAKEKSLSWMSDVDLLIVLNDNCSSDFLEQVRRRVSKVTYKYFPFKRGKRLAGLLRYLERATGMFISPFVCKRQDILRLNFKKVFSVSGLLSRILAPEKLVLAAVLSSGKIIFGESFTDLSIHFSISELIKSLLTCLVLAFSSLILTPITLKGVKYNVEAVKWSLLNTYFFLKKKSPSVTEAIAYFRKMNVAATSLELFKNIRFKKVYYPLFSVLAPIAVLKIHLVGVKKGMRCPPHFSK